MPKTTGLGLAATGAAIGALGPFLATAVIAKRLFGVGRGDPIVCPGVRALVAAVGAPSRA